MSCGYGGCRRSGTHPVGELLLCSQHRRALWSAVLDEMPSAWLDDAAYQRGWSAAIAQQAASSELVTYVVEQGSYVKIGRTRALAQRLVNLRRGGCSRPDDLEPGPVAVLAVLPGDREAALHARWADDRVAGEWFRRSSAFDEWLAGLFTS